jgi:hypothetical protein
VKRAKEECPWKKAIQRMSDFSKSEKDLKDALVAIEQPFKSTPWNDEYRAAVKRKIKKAKLAVHPDKNHENGAADAFKIFRQEEKGVEALLNKAIKFSEDQEKPYQKAIKVFLEGFPMSDIDKDPSLLPSYLDSLFAKSRDINVLRTANSNPVVENDLLISLLCVLAKIDELQGRTESREEKLAWIVELQVKKPK